MKKPREHRLSTLNKMFYYLSEHLNGNSCDMLVLEGTLDLDRVRRALQAVCSSHPNLRARVSSRLGQLFRVHSPDVAEVQLDSMNFDCDQGPALRRRLADNVWRSAPINVAQAPPLRVVVVNCPSRTYLQFISSHVWSDAKAGYMLVDDFIRAYNAAGSGQASPGCSGLRSCSIDYSDFDSVVCEEAARQGRPVSLIRAALSLAGEDTAKYDSLCVEQGNKAVTSFYTKPLEKPGFLAKLKGAAKARGVTVHALLTATLIGVCRERDLNKGVEHNCYCIHDLYSLRALGGQNSSTCYDNFVVPFDVALAWQPDIEQLIQKASASLNEIKLGKIYSEYSKVKLLVDLARYLPRRWFMNFLFSKLVSGNIICTNPGVIPHDYSDMLGCKVVDFYSFSQIFPPGRVMFVFNTFRDTLRVSVVFDEGAIAESEVALLVDQLEMLLLSLIDWEEELPRQARTAAQAALI